MMEFGMHSREAGKWPAKPWSIVQIHLWILPAAGWDQMLRFREVLRANSAVREAYEREKLRVAEMVDWDKAAYSLTKGRFIESVLSGSFGSN